MHSYVCNLNPGGDNIFSATRVARARDDRAHQAVTGLNAIFGVDNLLLSSASPAPMEDVKVLEALTKAYVSPFTPILIT